jgi:hypothetical protein
VRDVDAVLARHLNLGSGAAGSVARDLARQRFAVKEASAREALRRAQRAADALAEALRDLAPAIAVGAIDPAEIRGLPLALAQLSGTLAAARVPQDTKRRAAWVADQAAMVWEARFGKRPGVSSRYDGSQYQDAGPFVDFVAALYAALGIAASPGSQAKAAVKRLAKVKSQA